MKWNWSMTMQPAPTRVHVILSVKAFAYLAGFIGLSGGLVFGLFGAMLLLLDGEWFAAIGLVVFAPISTLIMFVIYAVAGYPIYRSTARRYLVPAYVVDPNAEGNHAL